MDEYFVTSPDSIFGSDDALERRYGTSRTHVAIAIHNAPDEDVLSADPKTWASGLAGSHGVTPPQVYVDAADLKNHGRVTVDCTDVPGVTYTMSEYGRVFRPGYRFELSVPADGEVELLKSRRPQGGPAFRAQTEPTQVVRTWDWPDLKGAEAFNREIEGFKHTLASGAQALATDVEAFNASLIGFALQAIDKRRKEILDEREFLGKLSMPVARDDAGPKSFGPPPIRRRQTPASEIKNKPPDAPGKPDLDEFYGHILDVIRAVGRGLERSPGSFKDAEEEALRDHMLVTLNTHYVGATYAEAFNRKGKTDILIRVYDRNAFIGECKWWHGPKALHEAFEQLFGYTTWRDSRVALIFYVKTKEITPVIEKAKKEIEARKEFIQSDAAGEEGELRFRVRWPDDEHRQATVTALFFHLS